MKQNFDKATQILLPSLTALGFLIIGLKRPDIGLVVALVSQIFWMYTSWQAWKKAGQIGIFISTILITIVVIFGIINYWFFK